jgi:hypothetical protein
MTPSPDVAEHAADNAAAAVMQRLSVHGPHAGASSAPLIQRACSQCEDELINRAAIGTRAATVADGELDSRVSSVIASGGKPLPSILRSSMENAFGMNFGGPYESGST